MDWDAWARKTERALDVAGRGDWRGLFAPGATFSDPNTPSTTDMRQISRDTRSIFPDWTQEITSIRGGEDWAVFEWIGRATYDGDPGRGAPIEMHGATIVEVDADGLVTMWRDYLDRKEP
ncbi:MAG: nuclear transport factor 2 family protein, partial [Acidimicrobiia bacterium]|nr:nuclear transport factor 2 family protein [Acidimicrobiia bacterium]